MEAASLQDFLTGLSNMRFFTLNYSVFLENNREAKLIFLDFTNLKGINSDFGHEGGDQCFRSFGMVLKQIFPDCITTRKSGDEFLILTNSSYEEIAEKFALCQKMIQNHFILGTVPIAYGFNAGVVPAEHGINSTLEKADITMYHAKNNKNFFEFFNPDIYEEVKRREGYIKSLDIQIDSNLLTLATSRVGTLNKEFANISDVYTRDDTGQSIFVGERYEVLRNASRLRKIDYINLKNIILSEKVPDSEKLIINLHSQTLTNKNQPFQDFISALYNVASNNFDNYILSINVGDFSGNFSELIKNVLLLKELGFGLTLSDINLKTGNPLINIWAETGADFVKISPACWQTAKENDRFKALLKHYIVAFLECDTTPIFMQVENDNDADFIGAFSDKSLVAGNFIGSEQKLLFKNNS